MDLAALVDRIGEPAAATLAGLITGLVFGVAAQRSRFCLRAATVEFARGEVGRRTTVWFLTFATALVWTQGALALGWLDLSDARFLASPGSISGAVLGGVIFGVGMVLARGCSGRLLVLGATGNLRSLLSGLVFAVTAQMTLHGLFSPLRDWVATAWITPGGANIHMLDALGLPDGSGLAVGLAFTALALWSAWRNREGARILFMASGVGFAVALGWFLTYQLSLIAFEPVSVESATFSGPSADTLMFVLSAGPVLDFDIGLVAGVFVGAFLAAAATGELALQGFDGAQAMTRHLTGAALMGFGAMTAGGCAIGAGVTGGSTFALTAWIALAAMWAGAMATDAVVDQPASGRPAGTV